MPILAIKHSALGDVILTLPLLAAIRKHHSNDHIVLLTTAPYVDLVQRSGLVDEIWTDPRPRLWQIPTTWQLISRLRQGHFSRIYDLQGTQRTQSYYRLLGSPRDRWVGNAKGCRYYIPDPSEPIHVSELRRQQLALVGIPDPGLPDLTFLQSDIERFGLPERFALLIPGGAPHRPAKRWPAREFATLARHLLQDGIIPILLGRAPERNEIGEIIAAAPGARSLCDQTSIADLATLGRKAILAVGNDTGPMHIIAASGCPALVLYSAESDPRIVSPRGDWVQKLQRPSLQDLPAADVIAALPPR